MSVEIPRSLQDDSDKEAVVNATYYTVRALRNTLRGYSDAVVSREAPPEIRELAERAIRDIEAQEKKPVPQLEDSVIRKYIESLVELQGTMHRSAVGGGTEGAADILAEFRSSEA